MIDVEINAWELFVSVVRNFLGKRKSEDYQGRVETLMESSHVLGCHMSIKMHFLNMHLRFRQT